MSSTSGPLGHSLVLLGLLALFWAATVLHLVRLTAGGLLPDRDPAADGAHVVMGATMAYMLFPDAWTGPNPWGAGAFLLGSAAFALRARRVVGPADPPGRRVHDVVIAVSGLAMASMLGLRSPSSAVLGGFAAALLVGCAVAHARILTHRHRPDAGADPGPVRLLATASGLAGIATTLGMAYLVAGM